jgi:hypothetical protein
MPKATVMPTTGKGADKAARAGVPASRPCLTSSKGPTMPKAKNQSTTDRAARTAVTPPPAPNLRQNFWAKPEAEAEMGDARPSNEGPSRDAWLIELCAELTAMYDESDRLFELSRARRLTRPKTVPPMRLTTGCGNGARSSSIPCLQPLR